MANRIAQSVKHNLVSIISLVVAIIALTYNTQRAEITEENRNIRFACFEILRQTNQLQQLTDHAHYDGDLTRGDPIVGWAHVNYINDLAMVLPASLVGRGEQLHAQWHNHFGALGKLEDNRQKAASLAANQAISQAIADLRTEVRDLLKSLE